MNYSTKEMKTLKIIVGMACEKKTCWKPLKDGCLNKLLAYLWSGDMASA